jgi:hypothetical protein
MSNCKINILGTEYQVLTKNYNEEKSFESRKIYAFCDLYAKEIIMCNPHTYPGWDDDDKTLETYHKSMLRHEIIHAFLFESGLSENSASTEAWATNEEMVDWFARQGPKIYAAWKDADAE